MDHNSSNQWQKRTNSNDTIATTQSGSHHSSSSVSATVQCNNNSSFEFLDMSSCDETQKIKLKNTLYSSSSGSSTTAPFSAPPPAPQASSTATSGPLRYRSTYANRNPANNKFTSSPQQQYSTTIQSYHTNPNSNVPPPTKNQQSSYQQSHHHHHHHHQSKYPNTSTKHEYDPPITTSTSTTTMRQYPANRPYSSDSNHYNSKNNSSFSHNISTTINTTNSSRLDKRLDDNRYYSSNQEKSNKWHSNSKKPPYVGLRETNNQTANVSTSSQYSSQSSVNSKKEYQKRPSSGPSRDQPPKDFSRDTRHSVSSNTTNMSPPLTNSQSNASATSTPSSTPLSNQNNVPIAHQTQQAPIQTPHYPPPQPIQFGSNPIHQQMFPGTVPLIQHYQMHPGYITAPGGQHMIPASAFIQQQQQHNDIHQQQQRGDSHSRENSAGHQSQNDPQMISQPPMNAIRGGGNARRLRSRGGNTGMRREYQPRHQSQNNQQQQQQQNQQSAASEYVQQSMMEQPQATVMSSGGYQQIYIHPYPYYPNPAHMTNAPHLAAIPAGSAGTANAQNLTGQPLFAIQQPVLYQYAGHPYPIVYPMMQAQPPPHMTHHPVPEMIDAEHQQNQDTNGMPQTVIQPIPWPHPAMAAYQEAHQPQMFQSPHQNEGGVELDFQATQSGDYMMGSQQSNYQEEIGIDDLPPENTSPHNTNDSNLQQGFQQQQTQTYDECISPEPVNIADQQLSPAPQPQVIDNEDITTQPPMSLLIEKTRDLAIQQTAAHIVMPAQDVPSESPQRRGVHLIQASAQIVSDNMMMQPPPSSDIVVVDATTDDSYNNNNTNQVLVNVPNQHVMPSPIPSMQTVASADSNVELTNKMIAVDVGNNNNAKLMNANTVDNKLMIKNKEKPPAWSNANVPNTGNQITAPTVKKQTATVAVSAIPMKDAKPPPPFPNSNVVNAVPEPAHFGGSVPKMVHSPALSPSQQVTVANEHIGIISAAMPLSKIPQQQSTTINANTKSFSSIMSSQTSPSQQPEMKTTSVRYSNDAQKTEELVHSAPAPQHLQLIERAKQQIVTTITGAGSSTQQQSQDTIKRNEMSPQRSSQEKQAKETKADNVRDTAQQTISLAPKPVVASSPVSSSWAGLFNSGIIAAPKSSAVSAPAVSAQQSQIQQQQISEVKKVPNSSKSPELPQSGPAPVQLAPTGVPGTMSYSAVSAQSLAAPQPSNVSAPVMIASSQLPNAASKKLPQTKSLINNNNSSATSMTPVDQHALKLADFFSKYKIETNSISLLPRGLLNKSNYCYINAILQALVACPPFYHLMKAIPSASLTYRTHTKTPVTDAMVELVANYSQLPYRKHTPREKGKKDEVPDISTDTAFEPVSILKMLQTQRNDMFPVEGRQEDAEEFLGFILNRMNDEMIELNKLIEKPKNAPVVTPPQPETLINGDDINGNTDGDEEEEWQVISGTRNKGTITRTTDFGRSPISDIFGGKLRLRVHREGDHASDNIEPFFTLKLVIEKALSVREALENFVGRDQLEGVTCSRTNQEVAAWQQVTLEELPVVLVLHLKCFDYKRDVCTKILKTVDFPVELKIDPKIMALKNKYQQKQKQYKLFAVVYHDGKEASKGHYITDVFHVGYSNWIRYDDSTVKPVPESNVLHPKSPRVPYLLFYRRYDTIGINRERINERDHHFSNSRPKPNK